MQKKIFKGIAVDVVGTVLTICVAFAVVPLYLKYLSPTEYGLWLSISAMTALIGALDIATDQYLITAVANNELFESEDISERFFLLLAVKSVIIVILLIVGITVFSLLKSLIKFDVGLTSSVNLAFFWAMFSLFILIICNFVPTILLARRHFSLVNAASSLTAIFSSLGAIFFLELGFGISSLPIAIVICGLLQYVYLFSKLRRFYPKLRITRKPINKKLLSEILKYSLSFHLVRCVYGIFRTQYILVAVGAFLGPSSVASFNVTNRVPSAISSNSMKLATPFFPSLAALFAQGDLVEAREIFFKINKVLVRISFFSVIVLFFANQGFVSLWVGDHLFGGKYVTGWLLLYVLLYIPLGGFGIIVYSSKRFGLWPFWLFVEMFVTIALSSYLASDFGMAGVVASFVIGATISQIYLFMLVQKELSFRFGDYLNSLGNYVYIPNIVTLLGAFILDHYIKISGWGSLISLVFILTILQFLSREGVRLILSTEVGFMKKLKWAFSL